MRGIFSRLRPDRRAGRLAAAAETEFKGRTKAEIPTPALLVDLDLFEANLKTLADHCKKTACGFRPRAWRCWRSWLPAESRLPGSPARKTRAAAPR